MPSRTREILCVGVVLLVAPPLFASEQPVRRIAPDDASRTSAAVVVDATTPLAHTGQILPLDALGRIVGDGRAGAQAEAVLDRMGLALQEARSGLDGLVKLNVYATRPEFIAVFKDVVRRRLAGQNAPAIGYVVTALPHPRALLALDAVATSPTREAGGAATPIRSTALAGQRTGGHVAILPPEGRVYVSGQAVPAENLALATRRTLEGLDRTLEYLGLDRSRVVQVKAFLSPMAAAAEVEREMIAFFGAGAVPPLVLVEWLSKTPPIEIEVIAGAGPRQAAEDDGDAISYLTPPGLKPSPVFSRVTRVSRGALIYVSGLYGPAQGGGAKQVEAIFDALAKVVDTAGGDLRHLVKATYYVSDDEAGRALNELRTRYYDPARPPAASKAVVAGVGAEGRTIIVDMIAVAKPEAGK